MLNWFFMYLFKFYEESRANGLLSTFKKYIRLHREIVPVEKDLASSKAMRCPVSRDSTEFLEISQCNFEKLALIYPVRSRYFKSLTYLNSGYQGFCIVKNSEIVGDIWYVTSKKARVPDVNWLGIELGEKDVYLFDMYVRDDFRGRAVTNFLIGSALQTLRDRGFAKAYGYFESDNIPALWVHRIFGYKELKRLKIQQCFHVRRIKK